MNTPRQATAQVVYCFDRFATYRRWAAAGAALATSAVFALVSLPGMAAEPFHELPRVTIEGTSHATRHQQAVDAGEVAQLPRVTVTGRRAATVDVERVAAL